MAANISGQILGFPKEENFAEEEVDLHFQQFFLAYLKAEENTGEINHIYFRIANQIVCLKFAGKQLIQPLTRALAHLQTNITSNPDFTICIWDSESSNQNLPIFFEQFNQFVNNNQNSELRAIRGDIPKLTNKRFRTALMGATRLTMADFQQKICVHWISDVAEIPNHELAAPLRAAFNFMFSKSSRQLIHGGAVGYIDGGVFLGGIGGSGKSTTALSCLAEMSYASDDYVVIDLENQPTAFSIYNTGKLKTIRDLARFPNLYSWIDNEDEVKFNEAKPTLFLNEHIPQKLISEIPLKAIVFPRFVSGEKIHYQPMSQQRVFREVVTSTVRQTPGDDQTSIAMIGRFIRELPCFELIFGEDQKDLPSYIKEIITQNS